MTGIQAIPLLTFDTFIGQFLWLSIGYRLLALLGALMADSKRHPILFIREESLQLIVQEVSSLFTYDFKPIICLIYNKG